MAIDAYDQAVIVTPHDSNVQPGMPCKGIYVGGAGNLAIIDGTGATVLLSGIPAGTFLPIKAKRIRATSTTATLIAALR